MKWKRLNLLILLAVLTTACPTKTTEEAKKAPEEPATNTQNQEEDNPSSEFSDLSKCPKFSDAPNPDEASTNYVLYRDFMRAKEWDKAFDFWKKVYEVAPGADGRRNTVFADGIRFYQHFLTTTTDSAKINEYIDAIFALYDEIENCYPQGGYIQGRKAFDLYYKYKDRATREEIYQMFKASIDQDGLETNDFVLNPFTAMLLEMYFDNKISAQEAKTYEVKIRQILANGLEKCKGSDCDRWKIIEGYAPSRLESFETVQGFYDCDYYMEKYYSEFLEAPTDCDVLRTVFSRLKWGGCDQAEEKFQALIKSGNENCVEVGPLKLAYDALANARYTESIELFQKAINEEAEDIKKAQYTMVISKIYNAHLKDFPKSRQYALKAAELNPNWGEPYILIGRLYASSGPLCGPGRGWDSQVVVWPAIDMWAKAKRVDPSFTNEANKWIGRYSQYMPSKEDVFIRNLKAGQSYRVGCWIQETTTIRTAD